MKHDDLRSIGHNIGASLASGVGLMVGMYELNVFGEAARSKEGFITIDFLNGTTSGGKPSSYLARAVEKYRDALPRLCAKHRVPSAAFVELTARYFRDRFHGVFVLTVADRSGRRTVTEYAGFDGQRVKFLDQEGRLRPKPIRTM